MLYAVHIKLLYVKQESVVLLLICNRKVAGLSPVRIIFDMLLFPGARNLIRGKLLKHD